MLVLAAYQQDNYSTFEDLWRIFIIFLVFGFAMLPFTYLLSFFFDIPSTGLSRLTIIYIITGIFAFMAYFIMSVEALGIQNVARGLGWAFLIFPHFSLSQAMSNLNVRQSSLNICKSFCDTIPGCTLNLICQIDPNSNCCGKSMIIFKYTFSTIEVLIRFGFKFLHGCRRRNWKKPYCNGYYWSNFDELLIHQRI